MRLIPRTILGQFVAGTVLVQVVVLAVFLVIGVREQFQDTQQRNRQRLQKQAETLASLTAEALAEGDAGQLASVYRSVSITQVLKGARLTDAQGKTLKVSSQRIPPELTKGERALLPQLRGKPEYRLLQYDDAEDEAVQPFLQDGKLRGMVWLYSDAAVTQRSPKSVLDNALVYGACALVGNLLLVWLLSTTIARPMRQLRRATLGVVRDPTDLSAFPLAVSKRNEAGELTESVNTMVAEIDLQRRGAQDALALMDSMLNNAPIGFAFFDREYRYVRVNEHLAKVHGVPMEEHLGRGFRDLVPPSASEEVAVQRERFIEQCFRTGEVMHDCEIRGEMPRSPDQPGQPGQPDQPDQAGEVHTWMDTFYPVRTSDGEVRWVGVIVNDITNRLRAEEALRRSEKLAAAGRLAASIAHEINNPLESVTNLLYLIRQHPSLNGDVSSYTELAQQELGRVAEITQQTLRFYRQSSGALDVRMEDVLRSVLVLHHGRLQAAQVEVVRRSDEAAVLFAFTGELRQLFANLVGNAADAMPRGGRLHLRLRRGWRSGVSGIWVTVADTGTGMPERVRRRIFEPFFTTKEATGTGLGLWVSDEILQKHRASMRVRSREARFAGDASGTVFRLFFPSDGVPRGPVMVRAEKQALAGSVV